MLCVHVKNIYLHSKPKYTWEDVFFYIYIKEISYYNCFFKQICSYFIVILIFSFYNYLNLKQKKS